LRPALKAHPATGFLKRVGSKHQLLSTHAPMKDFVITRHSVQSISSDDPSIKQSQSRESLNNKVQSETNKNQLSRLTYLTPRRKPHPQIQQLHSHTMSNPAIEKYGWTAVPVDLKTLLSLSDTASNPAKPIPVSSIPAPSSPLAKAVREHARKELPIETFNHSMRVFYYGTALSCAIMVCNLSRSGSRDSRKAEVRGKKAG
jgi:hypothetical protein